MKFFKLILFTLATTLISLHVFGQANPFINVLPSNSGIVTVGTTIDIIVTVGNTGPLSTVPQAKLRPIIQVPTSVTFLPTAQQTGLPAGWSILSNSGSQIRVCNSTDPIPVSTSRTIILKAQGVTVAPTQTFSGNINFGNGTTCSAGTSIAGDLITDNSATSTIKVIAPLTLNLNVFIEGYWDGTSAMLPVLFNQGQSNPITDCDSIKVELYNSLVTSPLPAPNYTTKAVLHTNGTASAVFNNEISGNYYIAIKHRNGLQTWSASAMPFPSTSSYNFSTAATQAFGSNQVEVATGVWALYSGDVANDENMDLLDLGLVESDINNFLFGYLATDINGDGNVDLLDSAPVERNINNFVFSNHP